MSQGPALQYDLSKLEGESWRCVELSDFTGTVMCWACLRRYSAVKKRGRDLQEFTKVILMTLHCFSIFFSTDLGTGSESCFHWIGITCLWKRLGVRAEKRQCSVKASKPRY